MTSLKEQKARGLRHVKNSKRYKDKTKVATTQVTPVKPKVDLESNWDRYKPLDEDAGVDYAITDFEILSNAPASVGSQFMFKSDKIVASSLEQENFQDNELFKLDLHLLNASLNTIPFQERYGFEKDIFSEDELNLMSKEANEAKKIYEQLLKNREFNKSTDTDKASSSNVCVNEEKDINIEDDLDLLLKITSPVTEDSKVECHEASHDLKNSVSDEKIIERSSGDDVKKDVDLEQWLDDILDD